MASPFRREVRRRVGIAGDAVEPCQPAELPGRHPIQWLQLSETNAISAAIL
jgi:hypothetical protein